MRIDSLNKRITFQKPTEVENEYGEIIVNVQDYKTVWADIEPVNGKEYVESKKLRPELTYKIITRYFNDITPDMEIKYLNRKFLIQDIINIKESNQQLLIMAIEKVDKRV